MRRRLFWQLAWRNLSSNRRLVWPFLLSLSLMGILLYVLLNLLNTPYVHERHQSLPVFMRLGTTLIVIFIFIFMLYASRLSRKSRKKEFALYAVMGMEKKHIAALLRIEHLIEYFVVMVVSVVGGHLLGRLCFALLNKLMRIDSSVMGDYVLSGTALMGMGLVFASLFILIQILSHIELFRSSPLELMRKEEMGEREPQSRWLAAVLGLALVLCGYYIALTVKGTLASLLAFFGAALMVMLGMYLCFTAFSIVLLKMLRRSPSYYGKTTRFLSISGMLYRMKANGVGLASICIMLTGLIITLSTVGAIYQNMERAVETTMPYSYSLSGQTFPIDSSVADMARYADEIKARLAAVEGSPPENEIVAMESSLFLSQDVDGKLKPLANAEGFAGISPTYVELYYLNNYRQRIPQLQDLAENEIYMATNSLQRRKNTELELAGKIYQVKALDDQVASNIAVETYLIVLPSYKAFQAVAGYYHDSTVGQAQEARIVSTFGWDASEQDAQYRQELNALVQKLLDQELVSYPLRSRDEFRKASYSLNGGFVFLGVIVALIFLIGTIIVIYYKQLSEAFEDKRSFGIMRQVGLPRVLIKQTANSQIVWMFFLPLGVAVLNTVVASKMLFQLLALFGISDLGFYAQTGGIVLLLIVLVYFVLFRVTSKVYYQIVS